jgi:hypothetical protein
VDGSGRYACGTSVSPVNVALIDAGIPGIGVVVGSPVATPVYNADWPIEAARDMSAASRVVEGPVQPITTYSIFPPAVRGLTVTMPPLKRPATGAILAVL